ncbi:MAG TPA: dienelactone hydrolase family protein, partial [Reyranella sp.]|nr:dienelactone hydrolase family protein [Reyranella sp.]
KAGVLVCTGADDPMIPADQVVAFEEEMRAAKADWQVISYGSTLHSFTNPEADGSLNPAILYNESTDKRSWGAMRDFFQEKFGG